MSFDKLRRHKSIIKDINKDPTGNPNPRFKRQVTTLPAKIITNTKSDMALLKLYAGGPLKFENTGRVCRECINFYYDSKARYGGRCRARGYMETHADTPADDTNGWTHPVEGKWFRFWPGCPLFSQKDKVARR